MIRAGAGLQHRRGRSGLRFSGQDDATHKVIEFISTNYEFYEYTDGVNGKAQSAILQRVSRQRDGLFYASLRLYVKKRACTQPIQTRLPCDTERANAQLRSTSIRKRLAACMWGCICASAGRNGTTARKLSIQCSTTGELFNGLLKSNACAAVNSSMAST